jgi:hypothetical protein
MTQCSDQHQASRLSVLCSFRRPSAVFPVIEEKRSKIEKPWCIRDHTSISTRKILGIGSFLVKYGAVVNLVEQDNMLFVAQATQGQASPASDSETKLKVSSALWRKEGAEGVSLVLQYQSPRSLAKGGYVCN